MNDRYPHPSTMTDERLTAEIIQQTADMREAQRAFFRLRKAGEDAKLELSRSRMLERVVDGLLAEWRQRQDGTAAPQGTLFPEGPAA